MASVYHGGGCARARKLDGLGEYKVARILFKGTLVLQLLPHIYWPWVFLCRRTFG